MEEIRRAGGVGVALVKRSDGEVNHAQLWLVNLVKPDVGRCDSGATQHEEHGSTH